MLKKILIGIAVVVAILLVVIATRPSTFHIERIATVAAPPEAVYAVVSDFHRWEQWSPWEKLDPAMTKAYKGAESGKGAIYEWKGNSDVGEGRMTMTEATPPSRIAIKLEFLAPWTATNLTTITMAPTGESTKVTWAMDGENNFMAKGAGLFMDMDAMIGKDFEKGLAGLKSVAEADYAKQKADMAAQAAAAAAVPAEGTVATDGTTAPVATPPQ
jgi:uncharacterized protein YndB with AHSA1/START domain